MAREQGDELGDPVVFTRDNPDTGEAEERPAYTPADEVNLAARGWVRRDDSQPSPAPAPRSRQPQVNAPVASPGAESV